MGPPGNAGGAGLAGLAVRQSSRRDSPPASISPEPWHWHHPLGVLMAVGAVVLISLGVYWDPVGARKGGRVLIEEYHLPGARGLGADR